MQLSRKVHLELTDRTRVRDLILLMFIESIKQLFCACKKRSGSYKLISLHSSSADGDIWSYHLPCSWVLIVDWLVMKEILLWNDAYTVVGHMFKRIGHVTSNGYWILSVELKCLKRLVIWNLKV